MAPGSRTTRQNPCVNSPADIPGEQYKLAGARSDGSSNEAPTPPKASIPPLVLSPFEDLFIKFMKMFLETTWAQALAEHWKRLLKAKTPEIYWGKFHMECYHFC